MTGLRIRRHGDGAVGLPPSLKAYNFKVRKCGVNGR